MKQDRTLEDDLETLGQMMKPDAGFVGRVMVDIDASAPGSAMRLGGWMRITSAVMAACVVMTIGSFYFRRQVPHPQAAERPRMIRTSTQWQTVSERTINLGGEVPAREVNRQLFERIKWIDPQNHSTFEQIVPRDKATLITLENY